MKRTFVILLSIFMSSYAFSQELPKRSYKAEKIESVPAIDGDLNDDTWTIGEWSGNFTQFEPYNGVAPSQPTEFKIRYDDLNIYVAIKAYDSSPDSINNRMGRRDNEDGDMVFVVLDSYHDLRTGFTFGVSSAGVRFDMIFAEDGNIEDLTWDPIWLAKSKIHDWGWAAEMKIPFTQLRFPKNSSDVWGLQVSRQIFRHDEFSMWQNVPRDASGIIHTIGELNGLQEIKPQKQFDIMPYTVGSYKTYQAEEGNPYASGKDYKLLGGIDGKIGITNNLTMDFTVFPDFGQVEADPSEVNLTAYESYFEEKRPFFVEGKNITSFNIGMGDGDEGVDNLFYSRRIGRNPHAYPDLEDNEYAKVPKYTNIIAAAKLTGKTENGLSIGIVEAVTAEEKAEININGQKSLQTVEPLTNYSIARIQKDFNTGNTIVGGMVTSTIRRLEGTELDYLHKDATTAGIDFSQFFNEKNYLISSSLFYSNVRGSSEAISETQLSSTHYFQRPDADYIEFDPNRNDLSGMGGKIQAGKIGGKWNWLYMNTWKSPSVNINDVGFMREADNIFNVLWSGYNFNEPFGIFRSVNINTDIYAIHDFGANFNGFGFDGSARASLKNMWSFAAGGGGQFRQVSNSLLRGGPSFLEPNTSRFFTFLQSDERKKLSIEAVVSHSFGEGKSSNSSFYNIAFTLIPANTFQISIEPEFIKRFTQLQYVDGIEINENTTKYIFASLNQKVLSTSIRLDLNITPDLTIQYWGQPFVATGKYSDLKVILNPMAEKYNDRFHTFNETSEISLANEVYYINDGADSYEIDDPNFSVDEFLSNLVIRWEFMPGSTAYLVWSQSRDYDESNGEFNIWGNMDNLFTMNKPNNTFLFKISYRFGLR